MGADIVHAAGVEAQLLGEGEKWDRVAVVRYPTRRSFVEMQEREDFRELHVHEDAGMERTIHDRVPAAGSPARRRGRGHEPGPVRRRAPADRRRRRVSHHARDPLRVNEFPGLAAFTAVARDPDRLAAQAEFREPAMADTYTLVLRPVIDHLRASV